MRDRLSGQMDHRARALKCLGRRLSGNGVPGCEFYAGDARITPSDGARCVPFALQPRNQSRTEETRSSGNGNNHKADRSCPVLSRWSISANVRVHVGFAAHSFIRHVPHFPEHRAFVPGTVVQPEAPKDIRVRRRITAVESVFVVQIDH